MYKLAESVSNQRIATKENVQRKHEARRIEGEHSDAEASASENEEDDNNEVPYNPKNLPLD